MFTVSFPKETVSTTTKEVCMVPPAQPVGQQDAHGAAGALHQPEQEQVEEDVARHVADVDHQLVVDEGGRGEGDGHAHGAVGQRPRGEEREEAVRALVHLQQRHVSYLQA